MFKYLLVFCLLFSNRNSFGQIFELGEQVDSIPLYDNNRKFMTMVNKEYDKLIKQRADSILLYYPIDYSSNYAVIFWKKKNVSQSIAFYQYHPPKQTMGKEVLKNKILNGFNIKSIYDILRDIRVRTIDTAIFISEDNPIYCQFYFGEEKQLTAGYRSKVQSIMNLEFMNAYATEKSRIVNRELKKSGVQRMSF